jgi:hypothetical protein
VPGTSRVAALVTLLRAARSLQLIGDLDALEEAAEQLHVRPRDALLAAAAHGSAALRTECLELVCVNPRCVNSRDEIYDLM